MKKLYVGGLPYSTNNAELQSAFETGAGVKVLSAQVIIEKETGRSRGFGFVEVDDSDAEKAINAMNGADLGGRKLMVNEARPMAPRSNTGGGFRRNGGNSY